MWRLILIAQCGSSKRGRCECMDARWHPGDEEEYRCLALFRLFSACPQTPHMPYIHLHYTANRPNLTSPTISSIKRNSPP